MKFDVLSQQLQKLDAVLEPLCRKAEMFGVTPPVNEQWYELLRQKLLPQLEKKPFLVVAITGGTNTGKSVVFNHFAGENASEADARAAGTKHPVCILADTTSETSQTAETGYPPETPEQTVQRHFADFVLLPWSTAHDSLSLTEENRLYWRVGEHVPSNLLLLDTPDVDSDMPVNWHRARMVRQAADVLVAVLTSQKYNDAAVKRFFRDAADAQKPVIILFNLCELENDDGDIPHLPKWVSQFEAETGIVPLAVYVAPHDKTAVQNLSLPFYPLQTGTKWQPETDRSAVTGSDVHNPSLHVVPFRDPMETPVSARLQDTLGPSVSLGNVLSELHFDTIKSQALLGAVKELHDPVRGIAGYLGKIEQTAVFFGTAKQSLGKVEETQIDWPGLPESLLAVEVRQWWHDRRPAWSRAIHSTYRKIGEGILWPVRKMWNITYHAMKSDGTSSPTNKRSGQGKDSGKDSGKDARKEVDKTLATSSANVEEFRSQEFGSVMLLVEKTIARLERMAQTDNPILREAMFILLQGDHRKSLVEQAKIAHKQMPPVNDEFRQYLFAELDRWAAEHPNTVSVAKGIDHSMAIVQPVFTLTLGVGGWMAAGQILGSTAGTFILSQVVGQAAITGGVTAGGTVVVQQGGKGVAKSLAELFRNIQQKYTEDRAGKFLESFSQTLWLDVTKRLSEGESLATSEEFQAVKRCLAQLKSMSVPLVP